MNDRLADPEPLQLGPERLGGEVEVEVVAAAGIDPDRALRAQRIGPFGGHADWVPGEPSVPDLGPDAAGGELERQLDRAVRIGAVAGGHAPYVEEHTVGRLRAPRTCPNI